MNPALVRYRETQDEVEANGPVHERAGRPCGRAPQTDKHVSIRIASPGDLERLRGMFSRASSESVYLRFHMPYPEVPEWMLALMLDRDHRDKESLVAVVDGKIVGHAMYAMLGDGEAELAIVVEDGWQSRGVGKALLRTLADDARRQGIAAFVGTVLMGNRRMLGLLDAVFAGSRRVIDDGAYLVRMPLRTLGPAAPVGDLRRAA